MGFGYSYGRKPTIGTPVRPSAPLAQGLVSWFPLLGEGVPVDYAGQVAAASSTVPWTGSPYGPQLTFAGNSSTYCNVTNNPGLSNLSGAFTVMVAAQPPTILSNGHVINTWGSTTSHGFALMFNHNANHELELLVFDAVGMSGNAISSSNVIDGNAHVWAATYDGSSLISLYRDGIAIGSGAYTHGMAAPGSDVKYIGCNASLGANLSGPLWWLAIWNYALSPAAISQIGGDIPSIYQHLHGRPRYAEMAATPTPTSTGVWTPPQLSWTPPQGAWTPPQQTWS